MQSVSTLLQLFFTSLIIFEFGAIMCGGGGTHSGGPDDLPAHPGEMGPQSDCPGEGGIQFGGPES